MFQNDTRPWAKKRRLIIFGILSPFFVLVSVTIFFAFFSKVESCFDGEQNGMERGVDCGGGCIRICTADVAPLRPVWSNSFEIAEGQYNSVAFIENTNRTAGAQELSYTFSLFNGEEVVAERSGVAVVPPNSTFPVFESRIFTDERQPITSTKFSFKSPGVWQPAAITTQVRSRDFVLTSEKTRPRLDARIENLSEETVFALPVVATVFGPNDQPLTASQTIVPELTGRGEVDIVFTWPNPIGGVVQECTAYDDALIIRDVSASTQTAASSSEAVEDSITRILKTYEPALDSARRIGVITAGFEAELALPLSADVADLATAIEATDNDTFNLAAAANQADVVFTSVQELSRSQLLVIMTDGDEIVDDTFLDSDAYQALRAMQEAGVQVAVVLLGSAVDTTNVPRLEQVGITVVAEAVTNLQSIIPPGSPCTVGATTIDVTPIQQVSFTPIQ